jgi:hypothetical protein
LKNINFWDITPCSQSKANGRFGGYIASIFRVEEINSARNQQATHFFDPEDEGDMFLRNVG